MRMENQWLRMMMLNCFGTFDHYFINILIKLYSITVAHEKKHDLIKLHISIATQSPFVYRSDTLRAIGVQRTSPIGRGDSTPSIDSHYC